ncbi:TetR/AcrR family transcriptional regulator [Pseudonocardiaceae bacterium YIM PH 21723]|nr:TetR/AcrR family transcriptional regulator [Pseudonocardiaceae bacterium YIM PH 21723]
MAGVRQFDEDAVFARTLLTFAERGYRGTSMPDLAAATGVQRGSLYHAYGGKEQLFLRAFERHTQSFLDSAAGALETGGLTGFFEFCVDTICPRGCLSTRSAVDADGAEVGETVRRFLVALEDVVLAGLGTSREVARVVVTTTRGLAVLQRLGHSPGELKAIAATQTALIEGARLSD